MQFTQDSHAAIADGTVTLTIRLWKRPHAKVGGHYTVGSAVIEVDTVELLPFHAISDADLERTGLADREAVRARAAHAGPIDDDTLVFRIEFHRVGPRPPTEPSPTTAKRVGAVVAKLEAMDARSRRGPWTRATLRLIGDRPGTVSTELAEAVGWPRTEFKASVRKLKALGLTESLEVGYQLTRLGAKVLETEKKVARSRDSGRPGHGRD